MMRPKTLFAQLLVSQLVFVAILVIAGEILAERVFRQATVEQISIQLESEARGLIELWLGNSTATSQALPQPVLTAISVDHLTRFSVIAPNGEVLADSWKDASVLENHATRPEIQSALRGRLATSTRWSDTIREDLFYVAVPAFRDGSVVGVVRAARSVTGFEKTLAKVRGGLVLAGLLLSIASLLLSSLVARRILRPIEGMKSAARRFAAGEDSPPLDLPEVEEFAILARALNRVAARVQEQFREVVAERNERETILASMMEAVVAVDTKQRVVSVNHAAASLFAVDQRGVVGQHVAAAIRNPGCERVVREVLEDGVTVWRDISDEIRQQVLQVHGAPIRDGEERVNGALLVVHDVTPLRRLEALQRDFVANVSHELKTPLTTIRGFVETLLGGAMNIPEDRERFLQIISHHVKRLHELIDNLLSLAALEQAAWSHREGTIATKRGDVRDVVARAIEVCAQRIEERGIEVKNQIPSGTMLTMNASLLEQALVNILDNAVKYSERGAAVECSAEQDAEHTTLSVRDHGLGMQRQHQGRVFDRFYRIDEGRARSEGGTGLGLAIVKSIAHAHRGTVLVESSPGVGTTIRLIIPTTGDSGIEPVPDRLSNAAVEGGRELSAPPASPVGAREEGREPRS